MKKLILISFCVLFVAGTVLADWPEQQKLMASDGAAEDWFGYSVCIDGFQAISGAKMEDNAGGANAGSAYVYTSTDGGSTWTEQQKLVASDGAADDWFGYSVSISGDYAIVGSKRDDIGAIANCGSAYIFEYNGMNWTQMAKLTASDKGAEERFGRSVSINGNYAIVGSSGNGPGGAAYVFYFNGVSWSQQAKLTASDADSGDGFGHFVSISGDYAIIGAYGDDHGGSSNDNYGAAYIFQRSDVVWSQQAKLTASDAAMADDFGASVSISGDYAIAGAPGVGTAVGAAYIFEKPISGWADMTETAKLTASDADDGDRFGCAVSIDGNCAVIGAYEDEEVAWKAGSAYIFKRNAIGNWTENDKLTASDGASEDILGWSVSISSDLAIAGAQGNDANGINAGAAYVFERVEPMNVPTATGWGLIIMTLGLLTVGAVMIMRKQSVTA